MPKRPCSIKLASNRPDLASVGRNNVYAHNRKPVVRPAKAPLRVERRQYIPRTISGMNWAAAANDSNPILARAADSSIAR